MGWGVWWFAEGTETAADGTASVVAGADAAGKAMENGSAWEKAAAEVGVLSVGGHLGCVLSGKTL